MSKQKIEIPRGVPIIVPSNLYKHCYMINDNPPLTWGLFKERRNLIRETVQGDAWVDLINGLSELYNWSGSLELCTMHYGHMQRSFSFKVVASSEGELEKVNKRGELDE